MAFTHSRRSGAAGIRAIAAIGAIALLSTAGVTAATAAPLEYDEIGQLTSDEGRLTGHNVDTDGDLLITTEYYGTSQPTGSVLIAELTGEDDDAWPTTQLRAPDGVRGFGSAVAIDAELGLAMVGARNPQQVHLYALDDGVWEPLHVIEAPTEGHVGNFAELMSYDDGHLAVAAPNSTVNGHSNAGRVFVYNVGAAVSSGGDAITMTEAVYPTPGNGDTYGQSLTIEDGWLVVGALQVSVPYSNNLSDFGAVRGGRLSVFAVDGSDVTLTGDIRYPETDFTVPNLSSGNTWPFGVSLAIGGDRLFVGSPAEMSVSSTDSGNPGVMTQGAVYTFDLPSGQQIGPKLTGAANVGAFGLSIAVDGETLLVGAGDAESENRGQIYVYDTGDLVAGDPADAPFSRQTPAPEQLLRAEAAEPNARLADARHFGAGPIAFQAGTIVVGSKYAGANGTVTVFEALTPVTRSVAAVDASAVFGAAASIEVTIDTDGPDGGVVVVQLEGDEIGSATVADYTATVPLVTDLPAGSHTLQVEFTDSEGRTATTEATVEVEPAATVTAAERTDDGISGQVTGAHGTVPTGTVEFRVGETVLGTAELDDSGAFAADVTAEDAVSVVYLGDANHLASELTLDAIESDEPGSPTASPDPSESDAPAPTEPGESDEAGDGLPRTGSAVIVPGLIAALLALIGGGVLLRRRQSA